MSESLKNVGAITLFVEDGGRTAAFADPDGHVWEVAQALSAPEDR